ncbi:MAG: ABC transporter ATP-binding protein [Eubacterium sp.]|nr:ABC transporter ATP-binding protein [Eubacterium sp.]
MNKNYTTFLKKYLSKEKVFFIVLIAIVIVQSVVQVIQPMFLMRIIDVAFVNRDTKYFIKLVIGMALCYVLSSVFSIIRDYLSAKISEDLCMCLRTDINKKISRLDYSYFDKHGLGDVLSKYNKEVETIKDNCGHTLIKVLSNTISLVITGYMIMRIDWRVMILSIVFILLYIACNNFFGKKVRVLAERSMEDNQDAVNSITDIFNNVIITKIYSAYDYINSKFDNIYKRQYRSQMQLEVKYSMNINISAFVIYGLITLIWLIEGFGTISGTVTIGTITALLNYQGMLVAPMVFFSQFNNGYQSTLIAIKRINSFLEEKEEIVEDDNQMSVDNIGFRNVSFKYKDEIPVLENVNLEFGKGKIVGVIGESGCGKSTLIKLLLNLYKPQSGFITINKENANSRAISSLRNRIVYSTQDSLLFKGSIMENLELGKPLDKKRVIEFSKKIDIFNEISNLPNNWNEEINAGSSNLSGGQKKRLDILRMLLHDSDVMIFDESTASLDRSRRIKLFDVLKEIKKDKIIIFITHNLEECRFFDEVYTVKERKVVKLESAQVI